ncbi:acyltransferase family protein [Amnibacterium flavum]|nr:acyltransferase [Amnibacterium flavum]
MTESSTRSSERIAAPTAASGRLGALDGLRGVAALVVVLHHLMEVARPHLDTGASAAPGGLWWWLNDTPLALFTAGSEAVVLFFVLSGLVVALPALRSRSFSWAGFLASRLVRIMLPVWAALVLASVLLVAVPRDTSLFPAGWLVDNNAATLTAGTLIDEATLSRYSYDIDNVLWSLRWEMLFAVLLPLFIVAARAAARFWWVIGPVVLGIAVTGFAVGDGTLSYLPAFLLGTLVAVLLPRLTAWAAERNTASWFRIGWPLLLAAALLGFVASELARPLVADATIVEALRGVSVASSVAVIVLAIVVPAVREALTRPLFAWLGRISFSLYLVHVPIIVALAYLLGPDDWKQAALLAIPVSFVVAHLFWRFVERPSHRAARALNRALASRSGSRDQTAVTTPSMPVRAGSA